MPLLHIHSCPRRPAYTTQAGSGPYPAEHTTISDLPDHTIYRPSSVEPGLSLPVVVWGNGACSANGTYFANLLHEVASHGFFVIANGLPDGSGRTTSDLQKAALDWVTSSAAPDFVDSSKISTSGQSCGGLESYDFSGDERVSVLGIFNSGFLRASEADSTVPGIQKPIFYFVGGEEDIAYKNVSLLVVIVMSLMEYLLTRGYRPKGTLVFCRSLHLPGRGIYPWAI